MAHRSPSGRVGTPAPRTPASPAMCPPTAFRARLSSVDAACCGADGASCTVGGVSACTVQCAARLRHFMLGCNTTMALLFDGMDGAIDGAAARVDSLHELCRAIPATEVVAELSRLQDAEGCVLQTDGVAETAVAVQQASACAVSSTKLLQLDFHGISDRLLLRSQDTRDNCATGISSGFMTCARDFCTSCRNAGDCDMTW